MTQTSSHVSPRARPFSTRTSFSLRCETKSSSQRFLSSASDGNGEPGRGKATQQDTQGKSTEGSPDWGEVYEGGYGAEEPPHMVVFGEREEDVMRPPPVPLRKKGGKKEVYKVRT